MSLEQVHKFHLLLNVPVISSTDRQAHTAASSFNTDKNIKKAASGFINQPVQTHRQIIKTPFNVRSDWVSLIAKANQ